MDMERNRPHPLSLYPTQWHEAWKASSCPNLDGIFDIRGATAKENRLSGPRRVHSTV